MKQKFILSFMAIALGILSALGQPGEILVVNAGNAEHITIAKDMDVVLVSGAEADGSISMDARASAQLNLKLSGHSLTIEETGDAKNEKLTVYLYVNNLKKITVENNTEVRTIGYLDAPKLEVFIDGEARLHLKTNGTVKAYSLNDSEINIKYL